MKKLLGIIGIGLVAGVSFSFFLNKKEKKKNNINTHLDDFSQDNTVSIVNQNNSHVDNTEFKYIKESSIENMHTRHEEASKIMKEAVDIIYSRTEIIEDENSDLSKNSDELDELLREDKRWMN